MAKLMLLVALAFSIATGSITMLVLNPQHAMACPGNDGKSPSSFIYFPHFEPWCLLGLNHHRARTASASQRTPYDDET